MAVFDKKLASILVEYSVIEEDNREEYLSESSDAKKSLSEYLVEKKVTTEENIIGAVAMKTNYPPIDLSKIDLDPEALALLPEDEAKRHVVVPVARIGNTLTVAVSNPLDVLSHDDINMVTGCTLMPVISTDISIGNILKTAYATEEEQAAADMDSLVGDMGFDDIELAEDGDEEIDKEKAAEDAENAPVVKIVNLIIQEAVKAKASDIHMEPYEKRVRIRYRIDGACVEKLTPPKAYYKAMVSRLKIMANLDIAERRKPQDGKFKLNLGKKSVDFRVSILPLMFGEKVVMRILDTSGAGRDLDSLGFEPSSLKDFKVGVKAPNGMLLVTGPTGSGKSTTLYSAIKTVISVEENITTVEDPVEYTMDGVNQVQVNERAGLTFAAALRSILRQDPDTVLIGEIRDGETAQIATKAALTGHLVFSTLHTNDAPSTITRLIDMGIDKFLVASSVVLVSAQRLARRLCKECTEAYKPTTEQMTDWGFLEEEIATEPDLFRPVGCSNCTNGYGGRLPVVETLLMNEDIKKIIVGGGSAVDIKSYCLDSGMLSLRRVGILNAMRGLTSIDEILSKTMADR